MAKNSLKKTTVVMLHPMAPYISYQMPNHKPGKRNGTTSGYCKHPNRCQWQDFDYQTLAILGVPMTVAAMKQTFEGFVRNCPTFGTRGGKRADVTANRAFSALFKEGLIVQV